MFRSSVLLVSLLLPRLLDAKSTYTQPLGISGRHLTTSIGIGTTPQYFDVALNINDDKFFLFDRAIENPDVDWRYDYVKQTFQPFFSQTSNITDFICRLRTKVDGKRKEAFGVYVTDFFTLGITQYALPVRVCDVQTDRSAATFDDDPLDFAMKEAVDGFLGLQQGGENPVVKVRKQTGNDLITLWLNKTAVEKDEAGEIVFGDVNIFKCHEKTKWILPADDDHWNFWVMRTQFESTTVRTTVSGKFDFSSTSLTLPRTIYSAIKEAYGGDIEEFRCDDYKQRKNVTINAMGAYFDVDLRSFITPSSYSPGYCQLEIEQAAAVDEFQVILGRPFLFQFCLTFDYDQQRLGFAVSRT